MCNKKSKVKSQKSKLGQTGQTLLELIVVVAVSVIVVGAIVFATIASLRNASFSKNQAQATKLAQEGIEKIRSIRDRDENNKVVFNKGDGTYTSKFSDLWSIHFGCGASLNNCYFRYVSDVLRGSESTIFEDISPSFHRQILIEDQGDGTLQKQVTAIVKWTDFSGPHESRLTTILRKIQ